MSLINHHERKKHILENIAFKTIPQIAEELHCSEKTVDRDIAKLKKNGEWKKYIEATILKLSQSGDVDDTTKFREYMKIYGKEFTEHHEVEAKGALTINVTFDALMKDGDTDKIPST